MNVPFSFFIKVTVHCALIFFSCIVGSLLFFFSHYQVDFSVLKELNVDRPTILLDDQGNEWARFQLDKRDPITIDCIPQHVINAFVAAEDRDFFNHCGVSIRGIIRSIGVNCYHGRLVQGASTITQQLVKLLFFNSKKTFIRKLKEQLYAILIEQQYTKEQILQTYLNHIYLGSGVYGIEAASQRFFSKSIQQVTVDEAALLAGVVQSPNNYCPLLNPLSAKKRRDIVLKKMKDVGFIDAETYELYIQTPLHIVASSNGGHAPHLRENIRQFLEKEFGKHLLYHGGFTVQTTLNMNVQKAAEHAFHTECERLKTMMTCAIDGAVITIDNATGAIKAMVGGYSFSDSKFNRATQAYRQIGSTIKPILYAQALNAGKSFSDTYVDEPISIDTGTDRWEPHNYDKQYHGQMTLAHALSHSNNIVTIKVLLDIGIDSVLSLLKQINMPGPLYEYPSIALGCTDATLKDVSGMFALFANGGMYRKPHSILWIKDRWGKRLYRADKCEKQIISHTIIRQVSHVLGFSLERIRKQFYDRWIDSDAISKTGTTNDSRTCWFLGATPELTTAVYIGRDDNQSMGNNIYPFKTAFPVWFSMHKNISCATKHFSKDRTLQEYTVNTMTGEPCAADDENAITLI